MAVTVERAQQSNELPDNGIPPLERGDRLTRAEFERRYGAMPHIKKAELLEGIVYMGSPVSFRKHSEPHAYVIGWLAIYSFTTPGIVTGDNGSVRLDLDNMPQPDAFVLIEPDRGGHATISQDDYVEGGPEFIFEIASTSASYDLDVKLRVYRRNAVQEYAVWRVREQAIDWFVLNEGVYQPLSPDDMGVYRSRVLPGLALDYAALISRDLKKVAEVQRTALESAEYKTFAERMENAAAKSRRSE